MELRKSVAERVVDLIYQQTGFDMIICSRSGEVIADSARLRLGVMHDIARHVLAAHQAEAVISEEDAAASGGKMKAGYHTAIRIGAERIGTFGIAGSLEIVTPVAKIATALVISMLRDDELKGQLQEQAQTVSAAIQQAAASIQEMTALSQSLAATSTTVAQASRDAAQQVKDTAQILTLIRRVADQTKLLGLNASIEASRAGEHGRGFTVVAGEVRKLAEESDRSAKQISKQLERFQSSIEQVAQGIEHTNAISQEQAKSTQAIASMVEHLQHIGQRLSDMSSGME